MSNPKLIILDLDDTLYAEQDFVFSGFSYISKLISKKIPQLTETEIYNNLIISFKTGSKKVFDLLIEQFSLHKHFNVSDLISSYKYHRPIINPFDDVIPFLKMLKHKGIPVVLLTDGDVNQQRNKVKALKIESYFNEIYYSDSYGIDKRKPNTFLYSKILNKFRLNPTSVINIGDNPNKDFYVNKSLGVFTIQLIRQNAIYANNSPYFDSVRPNEVILSLSDIKIE